MKNYHTHQRTLKINTLTCKLNIKIFYKYPFSRNDIRLELIKNWEIDKGKENPLSFCTWEILTAPCLWQSWSRNRCEYRNETCWEESYSERRRLPPSWKLLERWWYCQGFYSTSGGFYSCLSYWSEPLRRCNWDSCWWRLFF